MPTIIDSAEYGILTTVKSPTWQCWPRAGSIQKSGEEQLVQREEHCKKRRKSQWWACRETADLGTTLWYNGWAHKEVRRGLSKCSQSQTSVSMEFWDICARWAFMLAPSHPFLNDTMFLPTAGDQTIRRVTNQEFLQRSFVNDLLFCEVGSPCHIRWPQTCILRCLHEKRKQHGRCKMSFFL